MRRLARTLPILALAVTLSCAEMPTAPRAWVTLTGQITDRDGPGIQGVYVSLLSLDPRDRPPDGPIYALGAPRSAAGGSFTTVTDGSGRYQLRVPAGPYELNLYPNQGYPEVRLSRVEVSATHGQFNYRYTGVRLTGTITGPGGMALDAGINAWRFVMDGPSIHASSNLVAGRFSLLLPPGPYEIDADANGSTTGFPHFHRDGVLVARDTTMDIVLDGYLLSGVVRGQGGAPLERIRIDAILSLLEYPISTFSRADGSYRMYVPSGVYVFHLESWDDRWIAERDVPAVSITAPRTLDFDMSGVEWSGTVRRAADSTAVPDAEVYAVELQGQYGQNYAASLTSADGTFRVLVRRDVYYNVLVYYPEGRQTIGSFASSADSTFDLYVDMPLP